MPPPTRTQARARGTHQPADHHDHNSRSSPPAAGVSPMPAPGNQPHPAPTTKGKKPEQQPATLPQKQHPDRPGPNNSPSKINSQEATPTQTYP